MTPYEFDPDNYDALLSAKVARVREQFADFDPPEPDVFASPPSGFRMRAEFRMWHDGDDLDYVMYRRGEPGKPVKISEFPLACEPIQALMTPLLEQLRKTPVLRRKLFQAEFLSTTTADTLVSLIYHRPLEQDWEEAASELANTFDVAIVGRSRKQKVVIGRDYVTETLAINDRSFHYRQYEQAFTQPNAAVNTCMIEWATLAATGATGDLLELYCGNGNFTLPLSSCFNHVVATDLSKVSTRAAQHNIAENGIGNVHIIRLAAEEVSEAMAGVREFRRLKVLPKPLNEYQLETVFVDPPRAGLDSATVTMVSRFKRILYISCNPDTLAANVEALSKSHRITRFALFDQFPYTDHMECGVLLERIPRADSKEKSE